MSQDRPERVDKTTEDRCVRCDLSAPLRPFRAVVVGVSAGGLEALTVLLSGLTESFALPVAIVQHLHRTQEASPAGILDGRCPLVVKMAEEKESVQPGHVYFAPADYHLLVERDETFSLSIDERVNYSRPSIDVLFESAASVWASRLIGVILTGASSDGADGMRMIKECGGLTIAQDPSTARYPIMPQAAICATRVDYVLSLDEIGKLLGEVGERSA